MAQASGVPASLVMLGVLGGFAAGWTLRGRLETREALAQLRMPVSAPLSALLAHVLVASVTPPGVRDDDARALAALAAPEPVVAAHAHAAAAAPEPAVAEAPVAPPAPLRVISGHLRAPGSPISLANLSPKLTLVPFPPPPGMAPQAPDRLMNAHLRAA